MRGFVALLVVVAQTAAADPKLEPKHEPPPPPRVREIAHRLFEEAAAAAAEGNLDVAITKYHELDRLAPHSSITFNLAMAYEQKGELVKAIELYDKYVAAEAGDASGAEHLARLKATRGRVELEAKTKLGVKAVWYVDGDFVAVGTGPVELPPGAHRVDMISELGYRGTREVVEPGRSRSRGNHISMNADDRNDGNVVISRTAADRWGWFYKIDGSDRDDALGKGVHHDGRYTIGAGKHAIVVRDSVCDYETTFVVTGDELVLLHFDRKNFDERTLLKNMRRDSPACGELIVKRSVVRFDAKPPKR